MIKKIIPKTKSLKQGYRIERWIPSKIVCDGH